MGHPIGQAGSAAVVWLLRFYKLTVSQLFGGSCRFEPSCSEYAAIAICQHGPAKGCLLALRRLAHCHPFCEGGFDPVPPTES